MDNTLKEKSDHETFSWEEIKRHSNSASRWIVIDKNVYDITNWIKRHPGGPRVISHYGGQDATVSIF